MPSSARADPMTAAIAAAAKISAFMLWITPLRDAPPTTGNSHHDSAHDPSGKRSSQQCRIQSRRSSERRWNPAELQPLSDIKSVIKHVTGPVRPKSARDSYLDVRVTSAVADVTAV